MDPPSEDSVTAAFEFLDAVGACKLEKLSKKRQRARKDKSRLVYECKITPYGLLLADMPISLESSLVLVESAVRGMLPEGISLAAVSSTTPLPIQLHIGWSNEHLKWFGDSTLRASDKTQMKLASLAALHFYKSAWLLPNMETEYMETNIDDNSRSIRQTWEVFQGEEEWCQEHFLNADAIRTVIECEYAIINVLRRHRPSFLASTENIPLTVIGSRTNDICAKQSMSTFDADKESTHTCAHRGLFLSESVKSGSNISNCPVDLNSFCDGDYTNIRSYLSPAKYDSLAELMQTSLNGKPTDEVESSIDGCGKRASLHSQERMACKYFLMKNMCRRGDECDFAHTLTAPRPPCNNGKFCTYGSYCLFDHGESRVSSATKPSIKATETTKDLTFQWDKRTGVNILPAKTIAMFLRDWICDSTSNRLEGCKRGIVVLGDNDFTFSVGLCNMIDRQIGSTVAVLPTAYESKFELNLKMQDAVASSVALLGESQKTTSKLKSSQGVVFEVDATKMHCLEELEAMSEVYSFCATFNVEYFIWNFPFIAGKEDNATAHKYLLLDFFSSVSRLIRNTESIVPNAKILLSVCNDQASRWDIERLAKSQFFVITNTWTFDCSEFDKVGALGGLEYLPRRNMSNDAFPLVNAVTFEFTCVKLFTNTSSARVNVM